MTSLAGKIAVVTGATRGAGRGIAVALGEAGATVVCTGRTSRARGSARSDYDRPETIEETAELVDQAGGTGVPVEVDHLDTDEVAQLASTLRRQHGRIDVLVNDIWGGEELKGPPPVWGRPIWDVDLDAGLRILRLAVDTHLITAHHLLPLVVAQPGGLLVEVSDGTAAYNADHYRISAFYDLAKVAVNRLAFSLGHELLAFGACAVGVTPGWLRSEMMLDTFHVTEAGWREALLSERPGGAPTAPPGFAHSESPRFVGRGIAALAADADHSSLNQQWLTSTDLARRYGVTDLDGTQPDSWSHTP